MKTWHYLKNGTSLRLDAARCIGCGACTAVCPHRVFRLENRQAAIVDRLACMECGACAGNCPTGAIAVQPGVGCVAAIIIGKLTNRPPTCGCDSGGQAGCC
ncbi:MAG: ferredoxin [Spirochaetes bacterium GWD1_61_31]|nr:MAG: ferredoxin [Spirochaetes bacterium GWB1_60_80]OHD30721.1 MAG: ferredoxin [Spirochaetes bacterium GWC1_61_12]OHD41354.1 MAG: ferredoxin [Spirochaetes bacterium GWD1_61_31]OHD42682.1 MAG: ferredoxin [Spirochaetes bacterium GWE1_60_18]OHD58564.1 MAG: ferredoxin [Spirochaetes bacterium GWF1_60_12]HAW85182.1 ferredoxin [Spirochaetaceae bacterium]